MFPKGVGQARALPADHQVPNKAFNPPPCAQMGCSTMKRMLQTIIVGTLLRPASAAAIRAAAVPGEDSVADSPQ